MKVVLIHDWMIHMRGGEKVLEGIAELYPKAAVYTLFYHRSKLSPSLAKMKIIPSWIHFLPGIKKYYRFLLPILPLVIRSLKIPKDTELVISSSHCVAKGIRIPAGAKHLCYCHTPMRYLWGYEKEYFPNLPSVVKPLLNLIKNWLRYFDLKSNQTVDLFIANSLNVKKRIRDYYQKEAIVVYPPLDNTLYTPVPPGDQPPYYLIVSAFVPYKRVDLVIEAFNTLGRSLYVVGSGPEEKSYRKSARNSKIRFLGSVPDQELKKLYAQAQAILFPTEEDFGIVPLEAQACGTPVIAYGKGGALESVKQGMFFQEQTPEAIRKAVIDFEAMKFDRGQIPNAVSSFNRERFKREIRSAAESFSKK